METIRTGYKCDYCGLFIPSTIREFRRMHGQPCVKCGNLHAVSKPQVFFAYFIKVLVFVFKPIDWLLSRINPSLEKAVLSLSLNEVPDLKTEILKCGKMSGDLNFFVKKIEESKANGRECLVFDGRMEQKLVEALENFGFVVNTGSPDFTVVLWEKKGKK